jgi:phage replication O-like protein O
MHSLSMTNVVNFTSPQKENGYTPIANELLEQFISFDFSKRQMIVILTVARMTYGYSRKTDALSRVQIAAMTKLDRAHVSRTIDELVNMNVLIKHEEGRVSHGVLVNELSINKNYSTWITDAKTAPVPKQHQCQNSTGTDADSAHELMPKEHTHKANKTIKQNMSDFDSFWSAYPTKVEKKKSLAAWKKAKPNITEVLAALAWQVKSKKWIDGFIPNPTTYLNGERWNDEPPASAKKPQNGNELNGMKVI